MGADYSRVRFDPLRDFAGVLLQQGRVLLDADFNEYVALLDRRLRAEACDLTSFGPDPDHAGVAWVPRRTPEAFRVTASGGELTIGRGRMYVDGLLAENHGPPPHGFDPVLSESVGSADTPYDEQPHWPEPDALPSGGPHLAYLDVWQRELTHLEDPALVEVAVGVDTTARWQTVWQVRLLPDVGGITCASDDQDVPGWLDLITPSAGRLTTGTIEVDPEEDPCELPPSGGYRGLENQTYRVEVHDGGAPGTATFKWSRDNGSVALPVVEPVSPTVLRLASVGKDDVLRVSTGDWVEILDDRYELDRRPGAMRKVTVDDAARTITLDAPLPGDLQPPDAAAAAAGHLRMRRWDESGVVRSGAGATLADLDQPGASGVITVPAQAATQVVLEHGIVVSFSIAAGGSGRLRAGDYWVFAARTADTSLEALDAAPPLGVHHHYARLGLVTFPDSETDCRRLWPPLDAGGESCDCTVCVTPESHATGVLTVQGAIDRVKAVGGTVCLAAGIYDVADGVTIDAARSVRVRGQGPATVLAGRGTALTVSRSVAVTVESLAIVGGEAAPAAVRLRTVAAATVQDLVVLSFGRDATGSSAVELSGVGFLVALRRNVLVSRTGIDAGGGRETGLFAAGLRVEDNVVVGSESGIDLGGMSAYLHACRIGGNEVVGGHAAGIVATGAVLPGGSLEVGGNKVVSRGQGIVVGADAIVDANTVNRLGDDAGTDGIVVAAGPIPVSPGHVRITGNRVHDRAGTGIALRTAARTLIAKHNVLATVGAGIAIEARGQAERVAIDNNEVLDVATAEGAADPAVGILVARSGSATVQGNTVARVAPSLVEGRLRSGILVLASADVRVAGNVVDEIGPLEGYVGTAVGIAVVGPFDRLSAGENSARFSVERLAPGDGAWHALLIQSAGRVLTHLGGAKAVVPVRDGAVALTGAWGYVARRAEDHAGVAANVVSGGAAEPACLVRVGGDVVADANQCLHEESAAAVVLGGSSVTASSNRLRGGKATLVLEVAENRFAALGNLAPGGTHLGGPGAGLPDPWKPLNPNVS